MARNFWGGQKSKYGAVRVELDGIKFASKREAKRYQELKFLERCAAVRNLEMQVPYQVTINGVNVFKYVADFRYHDCTTGAVVVEDAKGFKTDVYLLKKKCVEAQYGIKIVEV